MCKQALAVEELPCMVSGVIPLPCGKSMTACPVLDGENVPKRREESPPQRMEQGQKGQVFFTPFYSKYYILFS